MKSLIVTPLFVALCALALAAAADERQGVEGALELKVGQERKIEGGDLRIVFERVSEDSRCPEGATCVWEGNAKARFVAYNRKGECAEFDLNTSVRPLEHQFGGYTIKLVDLAPRPSVNAGRPRPGDYRATLVVAKAGK